MHSFAFLVCAVVLVATRGQVPGRPWLLLALALLGLRLALVGHTLELWGLLVDHTPLGQERAGYAVRGFDATVAWASWLPFVGWLLAAIHVCRPRNSAFEGDSP